MNIIDEVRKLDLPQGEYLDGIPFLSLQKLAEIKKILARPKDILDIELIEEYLNVKSVS